ncbi:MAG: hypothetical protein K1X38_05765 [Microthrixaceae bacterium]|nr:hypothetical protein [Microthrixaceae bacterium]
MATTRPQDLVEMLMQIAHAIDMVNHLPDPASWTDEQLASFPIADNELRLLKHGANESCAINARLLAQFFLGDRHGLDARSFLDSWTGEAEDELGGWRSTASEHVAHFSPRRLSDPARAITPDERRKVAAAINAESNRFCNELLATTETSDLGVRLAEFLVGLGLRSGHDA